MARPRITPELELQIMSGIRAGAYPHIAAEAAGVPREVFRRWLRLGREKPGRPYRQFWRSYREAMAQARMLAETAAFKRDARFWLRHGPGKERRDAPGWAAPGKASPADESASPLANKKFNQLLGWLLEALEAFPEARLAILRRLGEPVDDLMPEKPRGVAHDVCTVDYHI